MGVGGGWGPVGLHRGGWRVRADPDPTRPDQGLRSHDKRGLPEMCQDKYTGFTTREASRFYDKQVFRSYDRRVSRFYDQAGHPAL